MKAFTDNAKQTWQLELPVGTMKRLQGHGWNLLEPESLKQVEGKAAPQTIQSIVEEDTLSIFEILWLIIEPQAKALGVTAEQFGERMASDCFVIAHNALLEELRDFFHNLRRYDVAASLEKSRQIREMATRKIKSKLAQLDQFDNQIENKIDGILNESFSTLQADLESTLGTTPGANSPG